MTVKLPVRPNIFGYQNFRLFLRDFYVFEKRQSNEFSYRVFSARAGFKSPNFLKLVIDGQRNLTAKSIAGIGRALKLNEHENIFFKNLVLLNQAKTSGEKGLHLLEISKSKVFRELYPIKQAELDFFQKWYCIPIREMIASEHFKEDPQWIADHLRPAITQQQASEALQALTLLGLVRRDADGRLVQCQKNVSTGDEVQSAAVVAFHKQMMTLSAQALDGVKRYQRDISSSTVLISESTFQRFKELVQDFRKLLLAEAESRESGNPQTARAVYQVNFQVFPLTEFLCADEEAGPCKKAS